MSVRTRRPWARLPRAGQLWRVVADAHSAAAVGEGHQVTQVELVAAHAALRLNDCGEEGGHSVARLLPHPGLVEGDAAGWLCARVSALLVTVEPVVVALAAAPEEEAAIAALGVVVVLGAAGPAAAHVRRQVAPEGEHILMKLLSCLVVRPKEKKSLSTLWVALALKERT